MARRTPTRTTSILDSLSLGEKGELLARSPESAAATASAGRTARYVARRRGPGHRCGTVETLTGRHRGTVSRAGR
jgi:hypothetical protein